MRIEIYYDIYCANQWVASANNLDEAMAYAQQYREDGRVEVFEVEKKSDLIFKASKIRKANEK